MGSSLGVYLKVRCNINTYQANFGHPKKLRCAKKLDLPKTSFFLSRKKIDEK